MANTQSQPQQSKPPEPKKPLPPDTAQRGGKGK